MTAPVLRFITAGSVDDGKSTLIGRLLYDSKTLLSDHAAKLEAAAQNGQTPDFAALTDGLAAEREQGITIDVAYRYFATPRRKFIIADTPGHEQYTRNMVTGASTADAAVVLIDATRVNFAGSDGTAALLPQTKRHSAILKLLGTPHIIAAVNKLDLVGFDENLYGKITAAYRSLAAQLGISAQIHFIPISALGGDNIVNRSTNTSWYQGDALLPLLENLPARESSSENLPAHFPVQRVLRQDGSSSDDFRGYQGRLEAGRLKTGDAVRILPTGATARIAAIYGINGRTDTARAGDALTLTLDADIGISRGDTIVSAANPTLPQQKIEAALCWFDDTPLNPARRYLLKHTTHTAPAKIKAVRHVWDVNTLRAGQADTLQTNDIGLVEIALQQPIAATAYAANPATGAFILIDEATNHTAAAGMIRIADSGADRFAI
ncbi:Sulfate adenylyltransferase subunit 1 [Kingella potus]|uniref:sulfate adenylyltransferase n=1 Tax=Kingella potus TaxID=265175 RepID=A0A377R724_9NEIS|nr:GTP-binding protein [Kingella potus]STR03365.1 Sulfate adenylyltransferase subunit 1 [Kingella potus]